MNEPVDYDTRAILCERLGSWFIEYSESFWHLGKERLEHLPRDLYQCLFEQILAESFQLSNFNKLKKRRISPTEHRMLMQKVIVSSSKKIVEGCRYKIGLFRHSFLLF